MTEELSYVGAITKGEIEALLAIRSKPRTIEGVRAKLSSVVLVDPDIADEMSFALPPRVSRRDPGKKPKPIIGASVIFARSLHYAYGSMRVASRIVSLTETHAIAEAAVIDVESGTGSSVQESTYICHSQTHPNVELRGKRMPDEVVNNLLKAAMAKAERNAILRFIPVGIWQPIYDRTRQLALQGIRQNLSGNVKRITASFEAYDVKPEHLLRALDLNSWAEITPDDVVVLKGWYVAIKDGIDTVENIFGVAAASTPDSGVKSRPMAESKAAPSEEAPKADTAEAVDPQKGEEKQPVEVAQEKESRDPEPAKAAPAQQGLPTRPPAPEPTPRKAATGRRKAPPPPAPAPAQPDPFTSAPPSTPVQEPAPNAPAEIPSVRTLEDLIDRAIQSGVNIDRWQEPIDRIEFLGDDDRAALAVELRAAMATRPLG